MVLGLLVGNQWLRTGKSDCRQSDCRQTPPAVAAQQYEYVNLNLDARERAGSFSDEGVMRWWVKVAGCMND